MTSLSRNNLRMFWRTALRSFKAKCGHRIANGEPYLVTNDYFLGHRSHNSQCADCANGTSTEVG